MVSLGRVLLTVVIVVAAVLVAFWTITKDDPAMKQHHQTARTGAANVNRKAPDPLLADKDNDDQEQPEEDISALAETVYASEMELLEVGAGKMATLRKRGAMAKCTRLMNQLLERAEDLDRQAESLPIEHIRLKTAANHMARCVTCNEDLASFNCAEARGQLEEWRQQVGEAPDGATGVRRSRGR